VDTALYGQYHRVFALSLLKFGAAVVAVEQSPDAHAALQDGVVVAADIAALVPSILFQDVNTLFVSATVVLVVVKDHQTGLIIIYAAVVAAAALHILLDSI
jgi:hypothetical protein